MADDPHRKRLGRGLAALMGEAAQDAPASERNRNPRKVPIEFVRPNPRNPRQTFGEADLEDLTASIAERGIIQPIIVRTRGDNQYEIIAGERRWRAAQRAGLHEIPIVPLDVGDAESLELAIIENVQRADLNPIEEAAGYQALADDFDRSQEQIAKIVGKSRSHVANTMRLLKLSDTVKAYLHAGMLTAGHARMLIGQPNADALAEEIVAKGLNVRQVEAMARGDAKAQTRAAKPSRGVAAKDPDTIALERRVSDVLGLQVSVDHRGDGGTLHIAYRDLDQLDAVLRKLEGG